MSSADSGERIVQEEIDIQVGGQVTRTKEGRKEERKEGRNALLVQKRF